MDKLPDFLLAHPILSALFLGLTGALAFVSFFPPGGKNRVSPVDATRLMSHEDALVLDVRVDSEFRDGHIVNALNIPLEQLVSSMKKLEKPKTRPIIATCRTGQRSATAVKTLREHGFESLYTLGGGIAAWESATLPLTKD